LLQSALLVSFALPTKERKRGGEPSSAILRSLFFFISVLDPEGLPVDLEFHQLELRYERLRVIRPEQERRLLASLAEVGQQVPIVVIQDPGNGRFVVIDGYRHVRSLRRPVQDTVGASCWPGNEADA
jgi:hypothetical protein